MDPGAASSAISARTKAIMPVHLYGHPADMTALVDLATRHGLLIFEDAAQAHGASIVGQSVGTFGSFGAFSFYPTKNMTAAEGGMVSAATSELARQVRLLRNQGMETRYANEVVGFNNRMTDIQAAIGRVQLRKLQGWTEARQNNARYLDENLEGVIAPSVASGAVHVYHQYTVRIPDHDRDQFMKALNDEWQVGSGVYYPYPLHRLDSLANIAPSADLPVTEKTSSEVLSLPVHPALTTAQLERIVTAVNSVAKAGA